MLNLDSEEISELTINDIITSLSEMNQNRALGDDETTNKGMKCCLKSPYRWIKRQVPQEVDD